MGYGHDAKGAHREPLNRSGGATTDALCSTVARSHGACIDARR